MREPLLGILLILAFHPRGFAPRFLGGKRGEDARHKQPVVVAQIDVGGHGSHLAHPDALAEPDELLQLGGSAMQPIQVVDDHRIPDTGREIGHHLLIAWPGLPVVGRDVVVHILGPDRPPALRRQLAAVLQLALHAKGFALGIRRDTGIDGRREHRRVPPRHEGSLTEY